LCLTLEEAWYLAWLSTSEHSVLLEIHENDLHVRNREECWNLFLKLDPAFTILQCGYCHLRNCGWVPKAGSKYGVQYVLYKPRPPHQSHSHAEYCALIVGHMVEDKQPAVSWTEVHRHHRLALQVGKALVLVVVSLSLSTDQECLLHAHTIELRRWQP